MDSSYITALETRARWLKWGIDEGYQAWNSIGTKYVPGLHSYLKCLEAGDTFFMNKRFCALVDNARSTVPDDLAFDSSWMQAPQGWLWIETPFTVPSELSAGNPGVLKEKIEEQGFNLKVTDPYQGQPTRKTTLNGKDVKVSALGWIPVQEGFQTADYMNDTRKGRIAGKGAYQFLCFQDFHRYSERAEGFGCWSYFMLQDGDKVLDRIRQFEGNAAKEGGAYVGREADMLHEIRWVYSAMYLMAQRLRITIHHDTDRATKRRAEREQRPVPPFIKVISLRRFEEEKKKAEEAGHSMVDWQWQWTVRGHWRNQFYPSTQEYKQIFIEAYIKGPEDKPMKPEGVRVFVARR